MDYSKFRNYLSFLTRDIWKIRQDEVSPVQWELYRIVMIVQLTMQRFVKDRVAVRASALTYSTLLSIIPILAILFGIARGFGVDQMIEDELRSDLSAEQADLVFTWVNSYLNHVQSGIFVGVGIVMLLSTLVVLIDNIEQSFNYIWQVKKPRSLYRKMTDYFSMILLLPMLTVVSSGLSIYISTYLKNLTEFQLLAPFVQFGVSCIPFLLTSLMFLGLYVFMPNTNVRLRHAWIPALVAGIGFQTFQYFYINSQIWISNYNAIYGSFAAIPFFLLWTQVSWTICLFGAQMSFSSQNLASYNFSNETENISRSSYNLFTAIILSDICKRIYRGEKPVTADELSKNHHIPIRLTQKIIYHLMEMKFIVETHTRGSQPKEVRYIPCVDIHRLSLGMLLMELDNYGSQDFNIGVERYAEIINKLEEARHLAYTSTRDTLLINM